MFRNEDRLLQARTEICAFEIYRREKKDVLFYTSQVRESFLAVTMAYLWGNLGSRVAWDILLPFSKRREPEIWETRQSPMKKKMCFRKCNALYSLLWMPNSNITQQECWTLDKWKCLNEPLFRPPDTLFFHKPIHKYINTWEARSKLSAKSNIIFYNRFY